MCERRSSSRNPVDNGLVGSTAAHQDGLDLETVYLKRPRIRFEPLDQRLAHRTRTARDLLHGTLIESMNENKSLAEATGERGCRRHCDVPVLREVRPTCNGHRRSLRVSLAVRATTAAVNLPNSAPPTALRFVQSNTKYRG